MKTMTIEEVDEMLNLFASKHITAWLERNPAEAGNDENRYTAMELGESLYDRLCCTYPLYKNVTRCEVGHWLDTLTISDDLTIL
jgi:hypothetical protein